MRGRRLPAGLLALLACATAGFLAATAPARPAAPLRLTDVARASGLAFRQGAFRFAVSNDAVAMMGTGLCWLDADGDGWLDLYAVNGYAEREVARLEQTDGLPRSTLFRNLRGRFTDVGDRAGVARRIRGTGCVAGDLDGDGRTDLVVTTAAGLLLFWNEGGGRFREGAAAAGIEAPGWRTSAAIGDVDGDGRADLYVAGYTDLNAPIPGSDAGFPSNHLGVADRLFLADGTPRGGRPHFREVGQAAGLDPARADHTLGAVLSDLDRDGRLDLVVANDEDPNRLYQNVAWPGGRRTDPARLGFRFEERGGPAGAADPNAGMGVAAQDYTGDGLPDLFVSDSRGQPHAADRGLKPTPNGATFADARPGFAAAFGRSFTGWGVSMPDLDLDGDPDLVLANGGIPVRSLARDAQPVQVLLNGEDGAPPGTFVNTTAAVGGAGLARVVGRGLAAADYDNDGDLDVAVTSVGGDLMLLRVSGGTGHWLEVAPEGLVPGTRVTALLPDGRRLTRELQAGSSYLSSEDPRLHVGLGSATTVSRLEVRFPGGATTTLTDVAADRLVRVERRPYVAADCTPLDRKGRSVARIWDEAILDAIRADVPAPTTHARNLFHLSAAMWDAWAAYDRTADGYVVTEKHTAPDVQAAREAAISFAAYRVLTWRYGLGAAVRSQLARLSTTMQALCYRAEFTSQKGDSPAALGNRIAAAVIAAGRKDGSLEQQHYQDETYVPVNEPLIVKLPGTTMHDPTRWQPLALDQFLAQNGLPIAGKVQTIVGAQWGSVRGFALPAAGDGVPIDPGPPGIGGPADPAFKQAALDVIRLGASLDATDGQTIDIGLDARGANPLGTNDGHGYAANPVTGAPYAPDVVPVGDYGRALAEFWADGPASETPPGHWNTIANLVSDAPDTAGKIGPGPAARLRWDVELYFALNGAVHDAAIAGWGLKRRYDTARPISMIRYLAGKGQSSDRALPSYDPEGLPLVPGLVELVTAESSAPGQRHAGLAGHVGAIAVRAWLGAPATPGSAGGVGWILGTAWVPYQRPTFVTPAFPGYVSGHSTFSRAAAEVLTAFTGSPAFPGGELKITIAAGALGFEKGPSVPVTLHAATYYDAADQAGQSRLWGGIHVSVDDLAGRRLGARVGKAAWALAETYIHGTARS